MQKHTKKKSFKADKKLQSTADESFVGWKTSHMRREDTKSSAFSPQSSKLAQDLEYICKTLQSQNKNSQLLINQLLNSYGERASSKTIKKMYKHKLRQKKISTSAANLSSSYNVSHIGQKLFTQSQYKNRTQAKTLHRKRPSLTKLIYEQKSMIKKINPKINSIFC